VDPNAAAVCATLGITMVQLYALMNNPAFPTPSSNDGAGNITWSSITAFTALWTAAKANGWIITTASLPTFPFAQAAATPIGPSYRPPLSDPLFDL
jgi:hypothetical protein